MEKVVTFSQKGNGEPKIDYLVRMMIDHNALEKKTEKKSSKVRLSNIYKDTIIDHDYDH